LRDGVASVVLFWVGRIEAVAGFGVVSFFFFVFCAEKWRREKGGSRKREKKKIRLAARAMCKVFPEFNARVNHQFQARFRWCPGRRGDDVVLDSERIADGGHARWRLCPGGLRRAC